MAKASLVAFIAVKMMKHVNLIALVNSKKKLMVALVRYCQLKTMNGLLISIFNSYSGEL